MNDLWTSFMAIAWKEFLHIRRDRMAMGLAVSVPVIQLVLFGFIDQTVRDVPTVVVDQSHSRGSRELIDKLNATGTFRVAEITADPGRARAEIVGGRAQVGVVIPPGYQSRMSRGEGATVLVLIDGSDSIVSSAALAAANGLAADVSIQRLSSRLASPAPDLALAARPVVLFNPDGRTANFIIPGLIAFILQLVAITMASMAIVRERERGTLEQLLVTPVHPLGLMLGKLAPYLIIGVLETALILVVMRFAFRIPIRGSLTFLFATALMFIVACLSIGLFISTRARSQPEAQQQAQLFFLPSVFLTGYLFPVAGLPAILYGIGRLLPATHMIAIMRGIVLRSAGPADLARSVLALGAISLLLVWLSVRRFRQLSM
jgi:ABC-2 type transport system permease protein